MLESVSGSDAGKVRAVVEKWTGKGGNSSGLGSQKVGIPSQLEATSRKEVENITHGTTTTSKDLSSYAPAPPYPPTAPIMSSTADKTQELNKRLADLVKAAPVMLFMKGTPSAPQCGFSRQLVGILRQEGVRYGFFNILADEEVRQGLKVWADWPTFPQLWMGGELVGGLDIVSTISFPGRSLFTGYNHRSRKSSSQILAFSSNTPLEG